MLRPNETLWLLLVENTAVYADGGIVFQFKNGTQIEGAVTKRFKQSGLSQPLFLHLLYICFAAQFYKNILLRFIYCKRLNLFHIAEPFTRHSIIPQPKADGFMVSLTFVVTKGANSVILNLSVFMPSSLFISGVTQLPSGAR